MPYWLQEEADRYLRDRREQSTSRVIIGPIKGEPFEPEEEEAPPAKKPKRTLRNLLKLIFARRSDQHDRR